MTIVNNTTAGDAGADQPQLDDTVVRVDPQVLVVEDNIRQTVYLDRSFVASIRQHGVLVPVLAHADAEGNIVVRDGQLRVLAAREAGIATVPAFVVDAADEKAVRIVQQYVTNEQRRALSNADRADAWRQLSLEGMSVATIARKTGAKRDIVETGLSVAGHDVARHAVADYDLTLHQAAVLIKLDDDPDAVGELRKVAKTDPDGFDHRAQRFLDEKAIREEIAKTRAEYEAKGSTVVDWPSWDDTATAFLHDLQTADGEPLTEENYAGKPGYAIAVGESWRGVSVGHVVVDWKEHGLRHATDRGSAVGGKMTDEEKAARRVVVANNKAWDSAEKVRRAWLSNLLGRKRLPADALAFAASVIAGETFVLGRAVQHGHLTACELLGIDAVPGDSSLARLVDQAPTKATHVALAVALGALESATGRHTWRNPDATARRYFEQLAAWGYSVADVEQIVLGTDEPDAGPDDEPDTTNTDADES